MDYNEDADADNQSTDAMISEADADTDEQATSSYEDIMIECSYCNQTMLMTEYYLHMLAQHPSAYMAMLATHLPQVSPDRLVEYLQSYMFMANFEDETFGDTYESLSDLCDRIGYHEVGVDHEDLKSVAPVVDATDMETCPICLEKAEAVTSVRRLSACSHTFCSECIAKWLQTHKWCPVCKNDASQALCAD